LTRAKLLALFTPAVIVIAIDQWTKWIVRTTPELHRYDIIEGWLMFYYTKNDGMALGIDIFDTHIVSLISITATIGIIAYLLYTIKESPISYLLLMSLVIGGAFGNIIDRLTMAYVGGYGGLLDGHVVDFIFFYLKVFDKTLFPYIFNVADIAISVSIFTLLIFNKKFFPNEQIVDSEDETSPDEVTPDIVSNSPSED
jgi:signal peptidase II